MAQQVRKYGKIKWQFRNAQGTFLISLTISIRSKGKKTKTTCDNTNHSSVVKSEPYLNRVGVLKGRDTVIGDITTFTGYKNRNASYLIQKLPKELYKSTCDCDPKLHSLPHR